MLITRECYVFNREAAGYASVAKPVTEDLCDRLFPRVRE